jgi:hypothetical protein
VTAPAHAVVCLRRYLDSNRIIITNGAFTGLMALRELYDAGLCGVWVIFGALCLCGGLFPRAYLMPAVLYNGMFTWFLPLKQTLVFFCT